MFKKIYFLFFLGIIKGKAEVYKNNNNLSNKIALVNTFSKVSDSFKVKFGLSVDSDKKDFQTSFTGDITHKDPKNNREIVLTFSPLNLFKTDRLLYLEKYLSEYKINSKGQLVAVNQNEFLRVICGMENGKSVAYLENLLSDQYKETLLGKIFNSVRIIVKNHSNNGSFNEFAIKSFKEGGFFNQIGDFKHLGSLRFEEDFFSANPSFLYGLGKIFNHQHVIGIKLLSDLDKWNTILRHVFIVESFKVIGYGVLQFNYIKFLIAPVISYGYDKLQIIKLYESYSYEKDVEFSTLDSGTFNFIIPVSIELFSILQLEGVYDNNKKILTVLLKVQLINKKQWKVSINGSNTVNSNEFTDNFSTLYEKRESLNLAGSISYTVNGHTFTLKIKGNIGHKKFGFIPLSSSNTNFATDIFKYILPLIKLDYKYESQTNNKKVTKQNLIKEFTI